MRPKNKKHKHFSRTDNKKYQEQNHKKEKTNNNNKTNIIIVAFFIAFASTIQFSHNTPPHTHNTHTDATQKHIGHNQQDLAWSKGWSYRTTNRVAPDTQQHATKQNKPEHKHTHPCFTDPPTRAYNHVRYLLSPANKNFATSLVLTSTHTVTKQILYSP